MNTLRRDNLSVRDADEMIEQLQETALDGIEKVLLADANRAAPAEAEKLYFEYLEQFARLSPLTDEQTLRERMAPGLQQLIDRSPALRSRVDAYRAATDDLLRWRARAADYQAQARQTDFTPLLAAIAAGCAGTEEAPGFVSTNAQTPEDADFDGPIPPAVEASSSRLLGEAVLLEDVVHLGGDSPLGVTAYHDRTQAYLLGTAADTTAEVERLRADLLVTDGIAPATWDAAVGLHLAEQGDFDQAGGSITRFGVTGWASYHTSLSDQRGLVRLSEVERENYRGSNHLVIRVIVDPNWVKSRYFFHAWP